MSFAGFDRDDCPDLAMMARLKADTNLEWCGFYLPAPSQSGATWKGKRAALVEQGWGLAPIFVGQQIMGPGSHLVTMRQGRIDGLAACAALVAEGFPRGSWVYLDLENGPPFRPEQQGYVGEWVDAVEGDGFKAGIYCSFLFAGEVRALCPSARIWVFHVKTTAPHVVGGSAFPGYDPADSGCVYASLWQHDDEARLSTFGDLAVDLDSAAMRDPSAPEVAPAIASTKPPAPSTSAPAAVAPDLTPYQIALLLAGAGDPRAEAAFAKAQGDPLQDLVSRGLMVEDSQAVGSGYVTTEAGRKFILAA
jgi:Domain of unknown function (DUF1906)